MLTKEQILKQIDERGSKVSLKDINNGTIVVDEANPFSQYIFSSASLNKIDITQVPNTIDVNVTELRPIIPAQPQEFISRDSYNLLLSQSVDLTSTIEQLREEVLTQTNRIADLESIAENEISERTSIEQTNDVLLNQLEALSETIGGFSDQLSNALQKSVEESIFRNSLESQNEGFKAQIAALISQIDSLNAIITGLYAQLGAVLVERDIQDIAAETAAASEFSWNANAVVFTSTLQTSEIFEGNNQTYYFVAEFKDRKGITQTNNWGASDYRWLCGKDLNVKNYNRVPMEITIKYYYPAYRFTSWLGGTQQFFKFNTEDTFIIQPEQTLTLSGLLTENGVADDGDREGGNYFTTTRLANNDIPSNGAPAFIQITAKNTVNVNSVKSVKINMGLRMPYIK
jgi:hypothetical protein